MQVVSQLQLDENNVAFHPTIGNTYQLNEVGTQIINLLQQYKSKDEIIEKLSDKYQISKDELFIDVSDFISKLKSYGLYQ